jgi:nucleotide-binding universal stress UspA family protein
MLPIHTILHPTDFSERSKSALAVACTLARDHGALLLILHVEVPPVGACDEGVVVLDLEAYEQGLRKELEQVRPETGKIRVARRLVMATDPVAEILRTARRERCDLIVMGTHGRTGLKRLVLGSVAEQVLRRAPCPVLTVKAPFPPEEQPEPRTASNREPFAVG